MSDVLIYGAGADLVEVKGDCPGCDEYNDETAQFVVIGAEGQVRVRVAYTVRGVWSIAVSPVDEDVPMLAVSIGAGPAAYTPEAVIENVTSVVREAS